MKEARKHAQLAWNALCLVQADLAATLKASTDPLSRYWLGKIAEARHEDAPSSRRGSRRSWRYK